MLIEFHRKMLADEVRSAAFANALRQVIRPGQTTVADIGAGTGVLAFMAQKLGAPEVHLIERGPVIDLAARLADANGIPGLHFWQASSGEILEPPQVDVVVAEILGNLALEENALETLADARRFLKPGGTLIPARIEQFVAPVISDRFWRELRSWDRAPLGLDFSAARAMSFDNLYVHPCCRRTCCPAPAPQAWDSRVQRHGQRCAPGAARWDLAHPARISASRSGGAANWCPAWTDHQPLRRRHALGTGLCACPGPRGSLARRSGGITLESETGGGQSGIGMRWRSRSGAGPRSSRQGHDIGRGFIG
jgi:protein arginine N-methyltransferase 1